jgi:hypothetical protein
MEELGVKSATAEAIIRWIAVRYGVIAPTDIRKVFVERAQVEEWLRENRRGPF